jgi:hypothetical protein
MRRAHEARLHTSIAPVVCMATRDMPATQKVLQAEHALLYKQLLVCRKTIVQISF